MYRTNLQQQKERNKHNCKKFRKTFRFELCKANAGTKLPWELETVGCFYVTGANKTFVKEQNKTKVRNYYNSFVAAKGKQLYPFKQQKKKK